MAYVGEIYLGGSDRRTNNDFCSSAVAFNLKSPSSINEIYEKDNWQIELKSGTKSIIARTKNILSNDEIIRIGFILCEELLDLISIRLRGNLLLDQPGDNNIVLFTEYDEVIVKHRDFMDFPIRIDSSYYFIDKNGNIMSNNTQNKAAWHPAFRYYRFSQASSHLFEAYRNLFLAFEALLQSICPKKSKSRKDKYNESTKDWIKRALSNYGAGGISGNLDQYVDIRNKLSHAKDTGDISLY